MIINPIIPIWLMAIICIVFLVLKPKGIFNYIRQIIIIILVFVINLRIMIPNGDIKTMAANVDVMFVVDNTISILAEDYDGNKRRIDAIRDDCEYIMEKFSGASFSVVSFGNYVEYLSPFTVDTVMISDVLMTLKGQPELYAKGTSLNKVLEEMKSILDDKRQTAKIIFFISDGEVLNDDKLKEFNGLDEYIFDGAVLGYGTKEGGPMKVEMLISEDDKPEYLYYYDDDFERHKAISKIDEDNLKKIAGYFDIDYIHMNKQSNIDDKLDELIDSVAGFQTEEQAEEEDKTGYNDIYYIFVIPLVIMLIVDYLYYKKKA